MDVEVLSIRQAEGGTRYIAVDCSAADSVRRDRAMLDHIQVLACLDVDSLGRRTWERPVGCADTPAGRTAIVTHLNGEG